MTIFLIGTIACFAAPNFSILLLGRLIQAAGVGISMPLLQNIMLSIFPPENAVLQWECRGSLLGWHQL